MRFGFNSLTSPFTLDSCLRIAGQGIFACIRFRRAFPRMIVATRGMFLCFVDTHVDNFLIDTRPMAEVTSATLG